MRTRQTERKSINLPGRYFTGLGSPVNVILSDLSTGGCRFKIGDNRIIIGTRLQIFVGNTGPHHAIVKWTGGGYAGVTFLRKLDSTQFAQFKSSHVPDTEDVATAEFDEMPSTLPQRFC